MIISTTHASFLRFISSHTDKEHDPQHSYRAENVKWDLAAEKWKWNFFAFRNYFTDCDFR